MDPPSDVGIVVGTRPEIIKMAPIIRALDTSESLSKFVIHTNQHYDDELSGAFFRALDLSPPEINLGIRSNTHAQQTAEAMIELEEVFQSKSPSVILAQGDTNTVLATALVASKMSSLFGHVEAGIRSFDRSMPEEVNRVLADHVSDLCFAPNEIAVENLENEGIERAVFNTGNTIVDACIEHRSIAEQTSNIIDILELSPGEYIVATIHRPINTDNLDRLETIIKNLDNAPSDVIFPCHPRTFDAIKNLPYEPNETLRLIDPLDYLDFLHLQANARLIVTDSGGIQEEASILEVPCLTVRPNTERPLTVEEGVNELIEPEEIIDRLTEIISNDSLHASMCRPTDLYGDGKSAQSIVAILEDELI